MQTASPVTARQRDWGVGSGEGDEREGRREGSGSSKAEGGNSTYSWALNIICVMEGIGAESH